MPPGRRMEEGPMTTELIDALRAVVALTSDSDAAREALRERGWGAVAEGRREPDFDRAWSAVAAVTPPGYRIDVMWPWPCAPVAGEPEPLPRYHASARRITDYLGYIGHNQGASTPSGALLALRDALVDKEAQP